MLAAAGTSVEAIQKATLAFLHKKVPRSNHEFAPSAADFGEQCRAYENMLKSHQAPRITTTYHAVRHEFKDMRIIHRQRAEELERKGYTFGGIMPFEQFKSAAARGKFKAGSTHLWSTEEVWIAP